MWFRPDRIAQALAAASWLVIAPSAVALSASPDSVTLSPGSYATVAIDGVKGQAEAESTDTSVAAASVTNGSRRHATLTVVGMAAGRATVLVRDSGKPVVSVAVTVTAPMAVAPSSLTLTAGSAGTLTASNYSGTVSASSGDTGVATVSVSSNVVTVRGIAAGSTVVAVRDSRSAVSVPVTVRSATASSGRHSLIAWNDLGMHCVDGRDYSVFSILPPYNNLHAQLVDAASGKVVTSGVTLTYEAVADPTGSVNTSSAAKTNFWDWVETVYGVALMPDVGLTGNETPSLTPRAMEFDAGNGWFAAEGLPITPYDDSGAKNFYPTIKVVARDLAGRVLATTTTVLPVSDEMTCVACHASGSSSAARPASGWVEDWQYPERDWKLNILRLHDERQAGSAAYRSALDALGLAPGLYQSAVGGRPALCAACHASNALPGTGITGIPALTSALHTTHGLVRDPASGLRLDDIDNRSSCYLCHPGSVTRCLRGAMGDAVDGNGEALMGCQSCHGSMAQVGDPARVGWLEEPTCQACHYGGSRQTDALDGAGKLVQPADRRFATNADTPAAGFSLYRFSTGHGGLQCEACHGATHAEYPSSHENDNLQSVALQGYAGTVRECTVCHERVPLTASGGPHGMHTIGAAWVKEHHDYVSSRNQAECAYCHGSDYRGSDLAQVKAARTFSIGDGRTRSYAAGQQVGCYDCHNGPSH